MENTISFNHLWQIFKKAWWKIVIVTLIVVVIAGAITQFLIPRKYASSVEFYIVNVNQSIDYITSSTVAADQQLAANYIEIIKSDEMMTRVTQKLKELDGIDMSTKACRRLLSATTNTSASIFSITVTASDPTLAYKIACYITEMAPALVTEITKPGEISATVSLGTIASTLQDKDPVKYGAIAEAMQNAADQLKENGDTLTVKGIQNRLDCIQVLRNPVENLNHVSPSLVKVCAIVAVAAAVLAYVFFFLRDFLNTMVRTEEDVKNLTDLPILGTIPKWDVNAKKYSSSYPYAAKEGDKQ